MVSLERSADQVICEVETALSRALDLLTPAQLQKLKEIQEQKERD